MGTKSWDEFDFSEAWSLPPTQREKLIRQVKRWMSEHPKEPFYTVACGDTVVFGFRTKSEVFVVDARIRKEFSRDIK